MLLIGIVRLTADDAIGRSVLRALTKRPITVPVFQVPQSAFRAAKLLNYNSSLR